MTAARLGAFIFLIALVACLAAYIAGWHRAQAGPGIPVCLVAMVACLTWLGLRGGRQ